MNHSLLKINNITKIYDNKIIYNDGIVSNLQWFPFQLEYVFKKLKISLKEKFINREYTVKQMGDILKELFPDGVDIDVDDISELKKYGLYKYNIVDDISPLNLGGYPQFNPTINDTNAYINKPDIDIYYTKKEFNSENKF
jgi:hypothetical protein